MVGEVAEKKSPKRKFSKNTIPTPKNYFFLVEEAIDYNILQLLYGIET